MRSSVATVVSGERGIVGSSILSRFSKALTRVNIESSYHVPRSGIQHSSVRCVVVELLIFQYIIVQDVLGGFGENGVHGDVVALVFEWGHELGLEGDGDFESGVFGEEAVVIPGAVAYTMPVFAKAYAGNDYGCVGGRR